MDIKTLRVFQHLAHTLHFGKTATKYHMSPSTLSRLIQRVEQQVGGPLLIRDNRSVHLTDNGHKFLDYANQQIIEWQRLTDSVEQQKKQLTGQLQIFCSVTAAYSHLPNLLDSFRLKHPAVEIMLTTGDAADAIDFVQKNKQAIAIAAKPNQLSDRIFFSPIAEIPLSIIAPRLSEDIQAQLRKDIIPWGSLPIIMPEHGPARRRFEHWFNQQSDQSANVYATVSGHEALVSMVALGCGIGIAPDVVVDNSPVKNRVETVNHTQQIQPFELGVCCNHRAVQQPTIAALLDCI
jgi:LysR family positive regulator for ilvC